MHVSLIALSLAGCAPRLGPPRVTYGASRPLPLVQPSTDARRWYLPMDTTALGPVVWFVDTGYTFSTCDDDLSDALGLVPRGRVRIRGELGRVRASKARLPPMELGGHRIRNLVCQVRDLDSTSSLDDPDEVPIAGVLGMDVLRRFRMVVDLGKGELSLLDPGEVRRLPRRGEDISVLRRSGLRGMRMRVPLRVGEEVAWLILDTGATNTYVDGARIGLEPSYAMENVTVRGTGMGGSEIRRLWSYELDGVGIGNVRTGAATVFDRDRRWWEPGLLGLDLLGRFHQEYDFAHHRARLVPMRPRPLPQFSTVWEAEGEEIPARMLDETGDAVSGE